MEEILEYFTDLSDRQIEQLTALQGLYEDWNSKINVVSRKDIDKLYLHHVQHSLSIGLWMPFVPGTKILDVGCGGGFPSVPLAILFPEVKFHAVDSIRKKLTVVNEVSEAIGLTNIRTTHSRVEEIKDKYDFVVTRAVANLSKMVNWTKKNVSKKHINPFPNGLVALKGGDLSEEIKPVRRREYVEQTPISEFYEEEYFAEKYIVYVQGG